MLPSHVSALVEKHRSFGRFARPLLLATAIVGLFGVLTFVVPAEDFRRIPLGELLRILGPLLALFGLPLFWFSMVLVWLQNRTRANDIAALLGNPSRLRDVDVVTWRTNRGTFQQLRATGHDGQQVMIPVIGTDADVLLAEARSLLRS